MEPIALTALVLAAAPLVLRAFKYVTGKTGTKKDDKVADFLLKNEEAVIAYLAKLLKAKQEADTKAAVKAERPRVRDARDGK